MSVHKRKRAGGKYVYEIKFDFEGASVTETVGTDKRVATRLEKLRRREVAAGTYVRPGKCSGSSTILDYAAEWFETRNTCNKRTEAQLTRDHILPKLDKLRLKDVTRDVVKRLIKALVADDQTISLKTAKNAYGVFRTMMQEAVDSELITRDPCRQLPPGTWPTNREMGEKGARAREPYPRDEAVRLMTDEELPPGVRVLNTIWFYTAGREGEACGLTWRQWTRDSVPLGSLAFEWQYDHLPLKGGDERPRKVPVHPVLAATLTWWWDEGFALTYLRAPTLDDFIVPRLAAGRQNQPRTLVAKSQCHTKSSAYKAFTRGCEKLGIPNRTLHSTRHTWITLARRGLPKATLEPALLLITHNAKGKVIDQYTHWEWEPLCEVLMGVAYVPAAAAQPVGARLSSPATSLSTSVFEALSGVAEGGPSVGFSVASSASRGIISENGGGAGNRNSPTTHVVSQETTYSRVKPTTDHPSNSRQFVHVDVSRNPQHGDAADAARNYLAVGSDGEPCAHLALQLAAAVMSDPLAQMAMAVLAGGPHVHSRATELASLVISRATEAPSLPRAAHARREAQ